MRRILSEGLLFISVILALPSAVFADLAIIIGKGIIDGTISNRQTE